MPIRMRVSPYCGAGAGRSAAGRTCTSGNCARGRNSSVLAVPRDTAPTPPTCCSSRSTGSLWSHGYVLGLGLGMVLDCDLIVAESGTRFQLTETSRGLGAAKHWAQFHFRGAGAFGDEVSLTGRYFTAEKALAANVINRVAPKDKVMEEALTLVRTVAANPPLAVRATVRARRWLLDRCASVLPPKSVASCGARRGPAGH
jgi:hypothetical protein